jgi:hypothetical protein
LAQNADPDPGYSIQFGFIKQWSFYYGLGKASSCVGTLKKGLKKWCEINK